MPEIDHVGKAILALLDYEKWTPRTTITEKCIPLVAPGKALRTYEQRRGSYVRKKMRQPPPSNPGQTRPLLTESEKIRSGARQIVTARLGTLLDSTQIERNDQGEYRLVKPWCPVCEKRGEEHAPIPSDELIDPRDLALVLDFTDQALYALVMQGKMTPRLWSIQQRSKKMRRIVVDALLEASQNASTG